MKRSAIALWLAQRLPRLARLGVRLWAVTYYLWPRQEHWLFGKVKSDLRMRLSRRVRLRSGQSMYVDPFDSIGRAIVAHGYYEPDTVAVFRAVLTPGMVVVDAGAQVGQYTLLASQVVASAGQVHAFEPDPITFGYLEANVAINRCKNVRCVQVALGSENGHAPFFLADVSNSGASSLGATTLATCGRTTVTVRTLDDYAASVDLQRVDFIKADVEGAELPLLRGGARLIARFSPLIVLEFSVHTLSFGYDKETLRCYLERMGYALFRVSSFPLEAYVPTQPEPTFFNVLAIPQSKLRTLRECRVIHQ